MVHRETTAGPGMPQDFVGTTQLYRPTSNADETASVFVEPSPLSHDQLSVV